MLLGSSYVGFLVRDNGQTAQRTGKYLGFCPTKNSGCSYTYIPGFLHKKYFLFSRLKLVLIFVKFERKFNFFGPA